ncbi:MAG: hypothetical protein Q4B81_03550 [Moraxella sp.]|nr:hypothetical protein [Moraxella sp.]
MTKNFVSSPSSLLLLGGAMMIGAFGSSAHAVSLERAFNNGGTLFDARVRVSPSLSTTSEEFSYLGNDPWAMVQHTKDPQGNPLFVTDPSGNFVINPTTGQPYPILEFADTPEKVIARKNQSLRDERLRMNGVNTADVGFSIGQNINNKTTLYTTLATIYDRSSDFLYVGDIMLRHNDYGSLNFIANGYLPTDSVATTSTFNPLDSQAGSAISAEYTYIPNVTLGGYYAFSDVSDPRSLDRAIKQGYGATATYRHSLGLRHNLSLRAGYTKSERDNDIESNSVARDKDAWLLGLRYDYDDWTLRLDGGQSKSDFRSNIIKDAKTNTMGVRVSYDFTPRLTGSVYYGQEKTKSQEVDGVTLNSQTLIRTALNRYQDPLDERQLFKSIKKDVYGVRLSYAYNSNLSFNARAEHDNSTYTLTDGDFAKEKGKSYSIGTTFSF